MGAQYAGGHTQWRYRGDCDPAQGLDYSHVGLAVWGKDGKLHLLNASSLRKKVVEEPQTLYRYMLGQRNQMGIRLVRLACCVN